jgi:hypothetical protein
MSVNRFDEILRQAREELSPEEQLKLAHVLSATNAASNGATVFKTLYDALAARGIIGSITDAPADLGTNPAHLEGLGKDD